MPLSEMSSLRPSTGSPIWRCGTLAVAYRPLPPGEHPPVHEALEQELVYLGVVGIIDPPRPEARTAVVMPIRNEHVARVFAGHYVPRFADTMAPMG